jgi:hypothetical protein
MNVIVLAAELTQYAAATDPADGRIVTGLTDAMRGGAVMFSALEAPEVRDALFRDGQGRLNPPLRPLGVGTRWMQSCHAALCLNDAGELDRLAGVDVGLLRASPATVEEYGYLHIDALCGYHRRDPDTADRLLRALKAADPDAIDLRMVDYTLRIAVPQIETLYHLIRRDASDFNDALWKALEQHKKYYATSRVPAMGQLAVELLGLACAALDAGLPVTVESDYIPGWLMERDRDRIFNSQPAAPHRRAQPAASPECTVWKAHGGRVYAACASDARGPSCWPAAAMTAGSGCGILPAATPCEPLGNQRHRVEPTSVGLAMS